MMVFGKDELLDSENSHYLPQAPGVRTIVLGPAPMAL
jgi:hypothetical protein